MTPVGLEPTLPKQGDFKSPVSANSTTGPGEVEEDYTTGAAWRVVDGSGLWAGHKRAQSCAEYPGDGGAWGMREKGIAASGTVLIRV